VPSDLPPSVILTVPGKTTDDEVIGPIPAATAAYDADANVGAQEKDEAQGDWSKGLIPKAASTAVKLIGGREAGRLARAAGSVINTTAVKAIGTLRVGNIVARA
jgi:hypothetical protein